MNKILMFKSLVFNVFFLIFSSITFVNGQLKSEPALEASSEVFSKTGQLILKKYESKAYQLKPSKAGHVGLRMYRHYQDSKYEFLLLQGILNTNKALDKLIENGIDAQSIEKYVTKSNKAYSTKTEKKRLRYNTLKTYPNYRFVATKILRHVARLNELGLQHKHHEDFINILKAYNFHEVFADPMMIKAWGAQLANQVYWLKQLGIADHTKDFIKAVEKTYPNKEDEKLSNQQFENKTYTLTHIIIAASGYYQREVSYKNYSEIIDYFRANTKTILKRTKEDVIIEVGISLLLVDEQYPEIHEIRTYINNKVDRKKRMILSKSGKAKFAKGEHRNIIAVLLLDWQGCSTSPSRKDIKRLDTYFPTTLSFRKAAVLKSY